MTVLIIRQVYQSYGLHRLMVRLMILPARMWPLKNLYRQALYAALDIYRNRIRYREATANPLRKQYFDKGGDNEKLDLTKEEDE